MSVEHPIVRFVDRLERLFGRFAVPNLTLYLVVSMAAAWLLGRFQPGVLDYFTLDSHHLMEGEYWRVVTYLFMPPTTSIIWIFFVLMFVYISGSALEEIWGDFRYNLFIVLGTLGTAASCFVFPGLPVTNEFLLLAIFLAFAAECPRYQILLFFVIPMEIRFIAYVTWGMLAWKVMEALWFGYYQIVLVIALALANYVAFFALHHLSQGKSLVRTVKRLGTAVVQSRQTLHRCATCGATERSHPQADFRLCSGCAGELEYCDTHLRDHVHRGPDAAGTAAGSESSSGSA